MGYPVLNDRFFQEKRPTREFFARVKDRGPWSPSLLPVYEWQGVLYVAFSNLDDAPIAADWCPIQASPSLMMELYFELTASEENSAAQTITGSEPALELVDDSAPEAPAPPPEDDLGTLDFASEDEQRTVLVQNPSDTVDLSALTVTAAPVAVQTPAPSLATPPPPPIPEFSDDITPAAAAAPTPPPPPVKTVAAEVVSPLPASPAAQHRKVPAAAATPAPPTKPTDSPVEIELWKKMSQHFESSMICLFQKGQVLPVKWSPNLSASIPSPSSKAFSTLKASPFRIVARTQKSYHGFLVPNEISDSFFREWTSGQYPEHLTMSPIMAGELVVGFLMGWGQKTAGTKDSLALCESTAKDLGPLVIKYAETNRIAA
ncbi:MAG: hypothetical protein KF681_14690 [Bdellovibrionaceae bacterium]|nr:hypothetical protein [Pseudobdellovibrionaceae bacterium]